MLLKKQRTFWSKLVRISYIIFCCGKAIVEFVKKIMHFAKAIFSSQLPRNLMSAAFSSSRSSDQTNLDGQIKG